MTLFHKYPTDFTSNHLKVIIGQSVWQSSKKTKKRGKTMTFPFKILKMEIIDLIKIIRIVRSNSYLKSCKTKKMPSFTKIILMSPIIYREPLSLFT